MFYLLRFCYCGSGSVVCEAHVKFEVYGGILVFSCFFFFLDVDVDACWMG